MFSPSGLWNYKRIFTALSIFITLLICIFLFQKYENVYLFATPYGSMRYNGYKYGNTGLINTTSNDDVSIDGTVREDTARTSNSNVIPETAASESSVQVCPNLLRPQPQDIDVRKKYWQAQQIGVQSDPDARVFFMHAYFDDRPVLNGSVYIRMFVVVSLRTSGSKFYNGQCYLWCNWLDNPVITNATSTSTNGRRVIIVDDKKFSNLIISCIVPEAIVKKIGDTHYNLTHVSFNPAKPCSASAVYIPIVYPKKPKTYTHTFGMCESNGVSFGYFDDKMALWLIEWFEANIMFGITELNIYNATLHVSENTQKVLDYYQRKGYLILHQQHPPVAYDDIYFRDVADIAMRTALNDCMYRNMYRYKYMPTIDIDELFVPYKNFTNYYDIVAKQDKIDPVTNDSHSFNIKARAFYKNFLGDSDESTAVDSKYPNLQTSKYISYVGDARRPKSFFNPRYCLGAFAHYCLKKFKTAPKMGRSAGGLLHVHHYRNSCLKTKMEPGDSMYEKCKQQKGHQRTSTRMLDFADKLNSLVEATKTEIGIS